MGVASDLLLTGRTQNGLSAVGCAALVAMVSLYLHWEARGHEFAYDDRHAVVANKDVLGTTTWDKLLVHDFWGFDIGRYFATKSYRPLTIAAWRLLHSFEGSEAPSAFHFHFANIIAHAVACVQVFALARQIFSTLADCRPHVATWPALAAGLLFAAHPIHTEAVAGVVGFAELLCAILGLAGLQLLLCDDEVLRNPPPLFPRSFLGFLLIFAASLSKEIGITLCATVVFWDLAVIPMLWSSKSREQDQVSPQIDQPSKASQLAMERMEEAARLEESQELQRSIAIRCVLATLLVAVYKYGVRRTVSGGHDLVTFITRVENPFAFAPDQRTAALSVLLNHADYAILLLWPFQLSADWSYPCTNYVYDLWDSRNLWPLALYSVLVVMVFLARPVRILRRLAGRPLACRLSSHEGRCVRAALFVFGFIVVPFLPASNIFFWVGTAKAERLLYLPSLGLVLLLADFLVAQPLEDLSSRHDLRSDSSQVAATMTTSGSIRMFCVPVILALYAQHTLYRVPHWENQYRLFEEAYKVCPTSVRVLENMGIIWMTRQNLTVAEAMFKEAWSLQPNKCDLAYLLGLVYVRQHRFEEGSPLVREAAHKCAVRRDEAIDTLKSLIDAEGGGVSAVLKYQASEEQLTNLFYVGVARLQDQDTGVLVEGCPAVETAVWGLLMSTHPSIKPTPSQALATKVRQWYIPCLDYIVDTCQVKFDVYNKSLPAFECVQGRSSVAYAIAKHGKRSREMLNATRRYLQLPVTKVCFMDIAITAGEEICGTHASRFEDLDDEMRMQALASDHLEGRLSEAHRLIVEIAINKSPRDALLLQAKAELLAWDGQFYDAADCLELLAEILDGRRVRTTPLRGTLPSSTPAAARAEAARLRSLAEALAYQKGSHPKLPHDEEGEARPRLAPPAQRPAIRKAQRRSPRRKRRKRQHAKGNS